MPKYSNQPEFPMAVMSQPMELHPMLKLNTELNTEGLKHREEAYILERMQEKREQAIMLAIQALQGTDAAGDWDKIIKCARAFLAFIKEG